MLDFCAKKAAWCFTTDNVIRFIMDIPGGGVESQEEDVFRVRGMLTFDPADVGGSDSDYSEESVEEVNEVGTYRGRGCCFKVQVC